MIKDGKWTDSRKTKDKPIKKTATKSTEKEGDK
jgi:hypothetical protein